MEKPSFASQKEDIKAKEQSQIESAFLLTWLGLGAIILVEGIALAASGIITTSLFLLSSPMQFH